MLETFKKFYADEDASDMFVTGAAGTGKTTDLREILKYCATEEIDAVVCAFTHKACSILESKLPDTAKIQTLHSYLKKRPTVNQHAVKMEDITSNQKFGDSDRVKVLFIDEYSMVGERDFLSIQDEELKVVWIGDPNQLPPVGDAQAVSPYGKYQVKLTHIYRQAADNPLITPLTELVSFINGKPTHELTVSEKFMRGKDIVKAFMSDPEEDKVLLAFTNYEVENLNKIIQGRAEPMPGDRVFSPTTKQLYGFLGWVAHPTIIDIGFGEPIELGSKYKTLEHLIAEGYQFARLLSEEGEDLVMAVVVGHYQHKQKLEALKLEAAAANRKVEETHPGVKAVEWARENYTTKLAKSRAQAWKSFLAFNSCVVCIDFAHAMTVHKSQGSTYKNVYIDTNDLYKCAKTNFTLYLKLLYVAISRASNKVTTN